MMNPMLSFYVEGASRLLDKPIKNHQPTPEKNETNVLSPFVGVPQVMADWGRNVLSYDDPGKAIDTFIDRVGDTHSGYVRASFAGFWAEKISLNTLSEAWQMRRARLERDHPDRFER